MSTSTEAPIRIGVFDSVEEVQAVVAELRAAGFNSQEISVLCSDESKAAYFPQYQHEAPAGSHNDEALNLAGLFGAGLGTAVLLATLVTSAGTAIFAVGALAGVTAAGTFAALMMTRGAEKELADYYDQAVVHGKLLVAAESEDPNRQQQADRILRRHMPEQMGGLPSED